ncbi:MAG: SDR family NAD(P)-dependent oxidoreductase, partial [Acidobacteria bacterium]|nr:SDR family NAD(P)-dependent oxidoreductase [Acidobacteriota bacterium]
MEKLLRHVYEDLARGTLTQAEALEKIEALKIDGGPAPASVFLAAPVWQANEGTIADASPIAQHEVMLCDRSAADAEELASLLPGARCLSLYAEGNDPAQHYSLIAVTCFEQIQAILRGNRQGNVLVQVVVTDDEERVLVAGVSGLLRTATIENPRLQAQLILIPADMTAEALAARLEAEKARGTNPLVRFRNDVRQVLDWQEVPDDAAVSATTFHDAGVYLITGGLGALGLLFAKEILVRTTQATVVLTGRAELSAERRARLDQSFAAPERVQYRQVDLGARDQVRKLILSIKDDCGRLDGILHCAGMIADNFILKKTTAEFLNVLEPKVSGTVNLDRASHDVALDFFVLFSSFAGTLGNLGQADYAAANSFMDCFAAYRNRRVAANQRHGRTRSISWGLWQDGGMILDPVRQERLQELTGMRPMQTAMGMAAFHRSLALPYDQLCVADGDAAQMRRYGSVVAAMAERQTHAPGNDIVEKTQEHLLNELAGLLKMPARKIDPQAPLETYGIDSILALQLVERLEKTFGPLPKTLFFEYQTLRDVTGYFVESHAARLTDLFRQTNDTPVMTAPAKSTARRVKPVRKEPEPKKQESDAIAIIGLSGRYPQAFDVEAYWRNLRDGKDCIVEVPKERWDWREYFSEDRTAAGRHYSKWGGFIAGVDEFDPLFFNISPKEAKQMDPQERLFLQHAWMAIEDAGYTRARLQTSGDDGDLAGQVGVYAGVMYTEYQLFGAAGSAASIANRVSYALNLHGPSMTLDTMCSSSLTAIHVACQDLKQGRTSLAIAGGVNVTIHPNKYNVLSDGQFISSDGHCQSFGEGGDGYIPGEGVGVVVLKRLSDGQRDGDPIYGVIRGSALNHGGKTNGYTVPNPVAQATAISRALAEAHVDARHVSYIEAHGTGTKLGDPIEIAALTRAFHAHTQETGYCRIGSAKSNIGHCESAAGIAGLTKVLLQMRHQQIVPSLHSAQLNPYIDFQTTPFVVNQTLTAWEPPVVDGRKLPRIAGISSFGAGGSNAHLIIEEYPQPLEQPVSLSEAAIVLSARTAEQLRQKAQDLLAFVRTHETTSLASIAYTLQLGREAMDERLAFIVRSTSQLATKLDAWLGGLREDAFEGQGKRNKDALSVFSTESDFQQTIEKWLFEGKLAKLVDLWTKGLELDWTRLYDAQPQRISLPAYPFAREHYWIDVAPAAAKRVAAAVLHPLLHSNTSDLQQQSYSTTLTGDEVFVIDGAVMPAAYLEMARAAVQDATHGASIELRDIVLGDPAVVTEGTRLHIALFPRKDDGIDFEIFSAETIHCQGRASLTADFTPAPLDVAQLTPLRVEKMEGYVLHPEVLRSVVGAFTSVESLRIAAPCSTEMLSWVRPAKMAGKVDIDLCDTRGNVAVELRGVSVCQETAVPADRKEVARKPISLTTLSAPIVSAATSRPRITLSAAVVQLHDDGNGVFSIDAQDAGELLQALNKAAREETLRTLLISGFERLQDVQQNVRDAIASFPFPTIALLRSEATGAGFLAASSCDFLVCDEDGTYGADLTATGHEWRAKGWTCPIVPAAQLESAARELASALASKRPDALQLLKQHLNRDVVRLARAASIARQVQILDAATAEDVERMLNEATGEAIVLTGAFFQTEIPAQAARDLQRLIVASEVPVIAALTGDARGNALALALTCHACVYSRDGVYSAANVAPSAAPVFVQRLGSNAAAEILLTGADSSGDGLKTLDGVEQDQVLSAAIDVASRTTANAIAWSDDAEANEPEAAPIAFASPVVQVNAQPDGIVVVVMQDREAKNMFSDALVEGLTQAFAHIESLPSAKVVVLTGHNQYFALGGTKESLLAIQAGKAKFTDSKVFRIALDCKLPVIAAIQGHAIGAGWCLGMFADLVLLSDESRYVSPYMDYGFTPGAGATYVLPRKLGRPLGWESLMTAQSLAGSVLAARGLRLPVLPRADVQPAAMELAARIAQAPRSRLLALKQQLTAGMHEALDEACRREVAMHEQTFVGRAETLARIENTFYEETATAAPAPAPQPVENRDTLPAVIATLRTLLANELQMRETDIDEDAQFVDLGLDSVGGVSWVRKINDKYQTSIEATKVYNYTTLAQLSRHVADEAQKNRPAAVPAPAPLKVVRTQKAVATKLQSLRDRKDTRFIASPSETRSADRIAIIGMAGQFPQAKNIDEFWQNLADGRNCITQVERERWDIDAFYQPGDAISGKTNSKWAGMLEEYDRFDPLFFNISPSEAEHMDPQQRLFLQACWHSIEHAGYDARTLSGSKCGVFAGCAGGDYHQASREHALSAHGFTGGAASILAARISYFLNLQGPCVSIDTACSSSLVAIAQACDSLTSRVSDLALAGGVYVMTGPEMHIRTAQAGMLSADGRCFSFDQRANGFVPGEAVGVVVLKRLADAERDGDVIYGVLDGWGVNQDGRTNGITSPNPESQTRLEQDVYDKYAIDPANIQLIEAHGTATKLGDPIEVDGLKNAFRKYTEKAEYCALGSVKSNIGHCLTAAGVAGVIKVLLAIQHKQLPPTIHFERLNEHIDLANSPFYVNTRLQDWELRDAPRRQAAISSFGFSGTNAHLVIGEYLDTRPSSFVPSQQTKTVVPLSARTAEQLRQRAGELLAFLESAPRDLAQIAYTLQTGRVPMEERVGFLVTSVDELMAKLQAYVAGDERIEDSFRGQVKRNKEALALLTSDSDLRKTIDQWFAENKHAKLLDLWAKGLDVDWNALYGAARPSRISLPVYPFAKERYWIEPSTTSATTAVLHPLLHANVSDLSGQRYRSTLPALTNGACVEMARAALEMARGTDARALELHDIVWATPIAFRAGYAVNIELSANGEQIDFEIYGDDDVVYCQGSARFSEATTPVQLDVERLTPMPSLQAAIDANGGASSLRSLRIVGSCPSPMFVSARSANDIDLCDERGNVCAELRGLSSRTSLMYAPVWQASELGTANHAYAEHHVLHGENVPYEQFALACFERIQTVLRSKPQGNVLVQVVIADQEQAGISGLLKTAALENSRLTGQLILVPSNTSREELDAVLQNEKQRGLDAVVRYQNGARQVQRWERVATSAAPIAFKDGGVYLITGGTGGLGRLLTEEILKQTRDAKIIVTGRATAKPTAGRVQYRQLDLPDAAQVERLLADIQREHGQLNGILHCAGTLADNFLAKKSPAEFRDVLAPKVAGTLHLDRASKDIDLDFLVLFSSIASVVGNVGQADYAAANGFLDAFAAQRNAQVAAGERRGRTRSIDWSLWQSGGMRPDPATIDLIQQNSGIEPIATASGLDAFHRILASPHDRVLVIEGNEPAIETHLRRERLLESDATPSARTSTATRPDREALQRWLQQNLVAVLGIEASSIDLHQPFSEIGLDSFLGTKLISSINQEFGLALSNVEVFNYPTIGELAGFLDQEIGTLPAPIDAAPAIATAGARLTRKRGARKAAVADDRIAIIGMSGRYPQADDLRQFWENLVHGKCAIDEVPKERWDVARHYDPNPARKDSKWLGAVNDVDRFDPLFFRISPQEAECIDPQHRLFLQESYKAFEDAGYAASTLANKNCGVYLGISTNDYALLLSRSGAVGHAAVTSNSSAIAAARIAYYLNLKGPAISIDTACSSSLVAIHLASQALLRRETDMALAGGVTLWLAPESYRTMSQAGMFAADGRCKTFDDSADGIVNADGVGAVVLKRLEDARRDGDFIHGVILGSGINQDGKTNGITAPSVNSQIELERGVYAKHGIEPDTISYVEAHGTGTKLGDPIELEALSAVFREKTARKSFCALGSVKSNIGHTTAAAGVAGLQKVLLSMQHQTLVPTLHVRKENAQFDFASSPFYVSRETAPWNVAPGSLRRAAVSSFGFSGTNAHLVIEEYPMPAIAASEATSFLVPLSAKTPQQLRQQAQELLAFVRTAQPFDLASMAYTLQTGREAMEERAGFVVRSADELIEKLAAYVAGGEGDRSAELTQWLAGGSIQWNGATPRRMSLPTYPFARERCWIDVARATTTTATATAMIHPLLHSNTSDLDGQRYRSTFTGAEFFLADHQVTTNKVLPGVAYLEMARVAIENALPSAATVELHNVIWAQPIVVNGEKAVEIALEADGDAIDFEIASDDTVHCQGRATLSTEAAQPPLDLATLQSRMTQGTLPATAVYALCAQTGLAYGPTMQSITTIHRGSDEVLARLRMPEGVAGDYVLHPSLMDGALQAAIGLIDAGSEPRLPFALETLRILAPCTSEMAAWVRYANGSAAADKVTKLDVDLCDARGNVCVQMRGLSSRALHTETGVLHAIPVWQASDLASDVAGYAAHDAVVIDPAKGYTEAALACIERVQTILRDTRGKMLVQIVVPHHEDQPLFAGLSGLLKTAERENPLFTGQLILLAPETHGELENEKSRGRDAVVKYEKGIRKVLTWQEMPLEGETTIAFQQDGIYLITGGMGGLGILFAREILARTKDARVILTGRSALDADQLLQDDRVRYMQADVADAEQVRQLIATILVDYGRLDGILHAAGVIADAFLLNKTPADARAVLAPKVAGAYNLDHATRDLPLDFFVLFAAVAGAAGNPGQADYAAANGFLDQFAAHRNRLVAAGQRHGRTRAIDWPLWEAGGMAVDATGREMLQRTTGMHPMRTATGIAAFHRILAAPHDQVLIAEGDRERLRSVLLAAPAKTAIPSVEVAADADGLGEKTEQYLRKELSDLLKVPSHRIDPRAALENYGIDSILAMRLTNQLEKTFGSLPKTLFFEYQTIRELAAYFVANHAARLASLFTVAAVAAPIAAKPETTSRRLGRRRNAAPAPKQEAEPIAIIGLSGRYPEARNVEAYWNNLRDGKDCITEVPRERWDWREYYSADRNAAGQHYSKWGGFIEGVDEFDPAFFNMSPFDAEITDPQERLFLQHAWMAVEDAGYTRATLQIPHADDLPGQVGVYVGVMYVEYQLFGADATAQGRRLGIVGSAASIANRVSYVLNLHGPSMTLDTMCSS